MKSEVSKIINFEHLPEDARKELLDFYEYLLFKHGKSQGQAIPLHKRKEHFFKSVKKHLFTLPDGYKFDREELHER